MSLLRLFGRRTGRDPAKPDASLPAMLPNVAGEPDPGARLVLLDRLVKLLPELTSEQHGELYRLTVQALETLAHDQVRMVREALANTLKDVAFAPNTVVARLARDVEQSVAVPVLQFCANLTEEDLLDVITRHPTTWSLAAIAQRGRVSEPVAGAIINSGDVHAGSLLLDNSGAVIAEPSLEQMVERAAELPEWQAPLAGRTALPRHLALRLADFVDQAVVEVLKSRTDFDGATSCEIVAVTRRRLAYIDAVEPRINPADRAAATMRRKGLDDDAIADAVSWNDRDFVIAALGLLAKVPFEIVSAILDARNAKAITALTWRAGLSMRTAMLLQARMARLQGRDMLAARNGEDYPLTPAEMQWQLDFAGAGTP